jgi:DNA processing protein
MQQNIIKPLTLEGLLLGKLSRLKKPPKNLSYIGTDPHIVLESPAVAIVGTRKMTPYGRSVTEKLSSELARAGVAIISGNALGVDVTSQKAALDAGGRVIAVVASGLDKIYPATNLSIAERIVKQGGAIISEYSEGHQPRPDQFLERNRIIAGLADAVIVIEAAERSGSLNTALHASQADIPLFAVPGPITSSLSRGTNTLIKDGAHIITKTDDILKLLHISKNQQLQLPTQNTQESQILRLITEGIGEPALLANRLGIPIIELQTNLTMLEISGSIRQTPLGTWENI